MKRLALLLPLLTMLCAQTFAPAGRHKPSDYRWGTAGTQYRECGLDMSGTCMHEVHAGSRGAWVRFIANSDTRSTLCIRTASISAHAAASAESPGLVQSMTIWSADETALQATAEFWNFEGTDNHVWVADSACEYHGGTPFIYPSSEFYYVPPNWYFSIFSGTNGEQNGYAITILEPRS